MIIYDSNCSKRNQKYAEIAVVHGRQVRLVPARLIGFDAWVETPGDTS